MALRFHGQEQRAEACEAEYRQLRAELLMEAVTPYIDPNVRYMGVSRLREMNCEVLRDLTETLVIQDKNDVPLVVIMDYEIFLEMQARLRQQEAA